MILVVALAAFFRLWHITSVPPGLYPDEAMNGNNALEAIETGDYKIFYPENNGREGLFINIQSLSIRIFGNEPWALRIVSAFFGILTVLGLFFLAKELFKNNRIALFASFFLATSFWHIIFSRIGFRAIMAPFFLTWSMWLLFLVLRKACERNFQIACLSFLSGLLFGLGFHSYIAYRAAPLLLIPPFLILLRNKRFKEIIIFSAGAFIAVLPLLIFFSNNPQDFFGRTAQISVFSSESPLYNLGKNILLTVGMFFVHSDTNWRHNYAGAPQLWWPIAILFLIGIISQISKIKSQNYILNLKSIFLILWLVIMLFPVIISSEGLPHALRAIIVIPVVMIFSALGLDYIIQKIPKKSLVFVFILFSLIIIQTYNQYFIKWAQNFHVQGAFSKNYLEIGNYLNSLPQDTPKYVIMEAKGIDVRGIPMPSQTIMFITKTFLPEWQKEKNTHYILPEKISEIPENAIKVWVK